MGKSKDEDFKKCPPWLKPLLSEKFFIGCKIHTNSHKNECNMYCLDCMNGPFCPLCLSLHENHSTIQIRRLSYNDVVRVSDIQKKLDISGIQTYKINSARVVYLNERPQTKPGKGVANSCQVCARSLPDLDPVNVCSLACKVVSTSKSSHRKRLQAAMESDSEETCSTKSTTTREEMMNNNNVVQSANSNKAKRRRKGIPHRSPLF